MNSARCNGGATDCAWLAVERYPTAVAIHSAAPGADLPRPAMRWRVLMAVLGAVPATMDVVGSILSYVSMQGIMPTSWLWLSGFRSVLEVAGVVGLWLAVMDREPRLAVPLTMCGLIVALPTMIGLISMIGTPYFLAPYALLPLVLFLMLSPFVCGLAYVIVGAPRWRRRPSPGR
jgi:hypothetical protein